MRRRGRGSKKTENFADVINGCPLLRRESRFPIPILVLPPATDGGSYRLMMTAISACTVVSYAHLHSHPSFPFGPNPDPQSPNRPKEDRPLLLFQLQHEQSSSDKRRHKLRSTRPPLPLSPQLRNGCLPPSFLPSRGVAPP